MGQHSKLGEGRAKVLELVRGAEDGCSVAYVAQALDLAASSARYQLDNLVADDELLVSCDLGYKVYSARHEFGDDLEIAAETMLDPAPAPLQAPASVLPPPERPADEAPAPMAPTADRGPAPFAGLNWVNPDDEIEALEICVLQLGRLERPPRKRVMTYLASRFMADWPDKET